MIAKGLASTDHPILAHIIPIRRCNLSCTYCNEFDDSSKPVPTDTMLRRVDHLGRLGTTIITISGGEPLLHPELDLIISRMRKVGALAGMIFGFGAGSVYLWMVHTGAMEPWLGLDHLRFGIVGMAASLVAMVAVPLVTPAPDAETQAMVDEVRTPTGPAILGPMH